MEKKDFYTAGEAIARFARAGLSQSTFYRKVNDEKVIDKIMPEGRIRGALYPRVQVEKVIKEEGKAKSAQKQAEIATTIDWVTPNDLPSIIKLDLLVFEEAVPLADVNLYISWVRKNPETVLALFDAKDRSTVLAYITLLPLKESLILDILRGNKSDTDIQPEEIQTYEREGEYTLLAESVVSSPNHPEYIGKLMKEITSYWCQHWSHRRIEKVYARIVSPQGEDLVRKLFFAPLNDFPDSAYVLNVRRRNPSRFIQEFQQCIGMRK